MLLLYWVLAFALAWGITIPIALDVHHFAAIPQIPHGAGILIGVAPTIAALVAAGFEGQLSALIGRILKIRAPLWTYLLAIALPALFLAAPFATAAVTGHAPPKLQIDSGLLFLGLVWFGLALGEEIGWRGYAFPKLMERHSFWVSATILGVIWCVWHYPKLAGSPYLDFNDLPAILPWLALFSVQIFLANYVICWLFERSGRAVLVTTLFHTAFNLVATVYLFAAMDFSVTAAIAVTALLVWIFDPHPSSTRKT
jgi:uncharacterized protein